MHCVYLADLAATLSQYGPEILKSRPEAPSDVLVRYWTKSRFRHELWHRAMSRYRELKNHGDFAQLRSWWNEHNVVLEEILVSELLARVVAALGAQPDQGDDDRNASFTAITHGVFLSQVEASNRVARIILETSGSKIENIVRLNRLRYGVERWTDWLIGRVSLLGGRTWKYCIDESRAKTFCSEVRESAGGTQRDTTTWLMNAAMRDMLIRRTSSRTALPVANRDVASAALALFRPQMFDDYGVPKSLWFHKLQEQLAHPNTLTNMPTNTLATLGDRVGPAS